MNIWQGTGILIGGYVLLCVLRGEVQAKSGMSWETIYRAHAPGKFWLVTGIYALLTGALFFIF